MILFTVMVSRKVLLRLPWYDTARLDDGAYIRPQESDVPAIIAEPHARNSLGNHYWPIESGRPSRNSLIPKYCHIQKTPLIPSLIAGTEIDMPPSPLLVQYRAP